MSQKFVTSKINKESDLVNLNHLTGIIKKVKPWLKYALRKFTAPKLVLQYTLWIQNLTFF